MNNNCSACNARLPQSDDPKSPYIICLECGRVNVRGEMCQYIAEVLNSDGTIYDYCDNWETAQCLAMEGYKIVVVADDPPCMTRDEIQRMCDKALADYRDCFG